MISNLFANCRQFVLYSWQSAVSRPTVSGDYVDRRALRGSSVGEEDLRYRRNCRRKYRPRSDLRRTAQPCSKQRGPRGTLSVRFMLFSFGVRALPEVGTNDGRGRVRDPDDVGHYLIWRRRVAQGFRPSQPPGIAPRRLSVLRPICLHPVRPAITGRHKSPSWRHH